MTECNKCGKSYIQTHVAGKTFNSHTDCEDNKPFRLEPTRDNRKPTCFLCDKEINPVSIGDYSTGIYYKCSNYSCKQFDKVVHEDMVKKPGQGQVIALGSIASEKAKETYVAISGNRRSVSSGPRTNPYLPKSRAFSRSPDNGYSGEDPENHRLPNGELDSDLVHYASVGVVTNVSNSLENEE